MKASRLYVFDTTASQESEATGTLNQIQNISLFDHQVALGTRGKDQLWPHLAKQNTQEGDDCYLPTGGEENISDGQLEEFEDEDQPDQGEAEIRQEQTKTRTDLT